MIPPDPQHAVCAMVEDGVPLDHIEQYIGTLPLDPEYQSALWLLAWSQPPMPRTLASDRSRRR
jgi:hypothetical protein